MEEIREVEVDKVIGLEEEEEDRSVGHYVPFCLVLEENGKQVQVWLDYDRLIEVANLIKPYLEDFESREKMEAEWDNET
jgi:hypothetical protein